MWGQVILRPKALRVISPRREEETRATPRTMRLIHISDLHFGGVAPGLPDNLRVLVVHHPPAAPPDGTAHHLLGRLKEFT